MALSFDGINDAAATDTLLNLSSAGTGPISISCWLIWDTFANNDDLLMEHSSNYNSNTGCFILNPNDSASTRFQFAHHGSGGGNYRAASFTRPSAGVWHHYLFVIHTTDANNHKAFVDGASQSLTIGTNTAGATWSATQRIFFMSRNGTSLEGAGDLCEIAIWDADVSGAVSMLAGGAPAVRVRGANLKLYIPFFGTANPEPNYVPGSSQVTHVGGATQAAHAPVAPPFGIMTFESGGFVAVAPAGSALHARFRVVAAPWMRLTRGQRGPARTTGRRRRLRNHGT